MDIKQLKINGTSFYPKVAVSGIVKENGSSDSGVDTVVTEGSNNLVTSGAVAAAILESGGKDTLALLDDTQFSGTLSNGLVLTYKDGKWVNVAGAGDASTIVHGIKFLTGSNVYNPSNGVVVLPDYPSGGGEADSVAWANVTGKPGWIGSSKPSYTASEVGVSISGRTITVSGTSVTIPENSNSGTGGATNLGDLTDVTIANLQSGQVLKYNGTTWVNGTDNTGGTSGEPDEYIKSASKSGNKLTLTKKDDSTFEYEPSGTLTTEQKTFVTNIYQEISDKASSDSATPIEDVVDKIVEDATKPTTGEAKYDSLGDAIDDIDSRVSTLEALPSGVSSEDLNQAVSDYFTENPPETTTWASLDKPSWLTDKGVVRTDANQGLSDAQKSTARTNIGAAAEYSSTNKLDPEYIDGLSDEIKEVLNTPETTGGKTPIEQAAENAVDTATDELNLNNHDIKKADGSDEDSGTDIKLDSYEDVVTTVDKVLSDLNEEGSIPNFALAATVRSNTSRISNVETGLKAAAGKIKFDSSVTYSTDTTYTASNGTITLPAYPTSSGSGSEPTNYIKQASVNSNTLTLTPNTGSAVTFIPTDTKPNDGTLTLKSNGEVIATFSANQSSDLTINLGQEAQVVDESGLFYRTSDSVDYLVTETGALFVDVSGNALADTHYEVQGVSRIQVIAPSSFSESVATWGVVETANSYSAGRDFTYNGNTYTANVEFFESLSLFKSLPYVTSVQFAENKSGNVSQLKVVSESGITNTTITTNTVEASNYKPVTSNAVYSANTKLSNRIKALEYPYVDSTATLFWRSANSNGSIQLAVNKLGQLVYVSQGSDSSSWYCVINSNGTVGVTTVNGVTEDSYFSSYEVDSWGTAAATGTLGSNGGTVVYGGKTYTVNATNHTISPDLYLQNSFTRQKQLYNSDKINDNTDTTIINSRNYIFYSTSDSLAGCIEKYPDAFYVGDMVFMYGAGTTTPCWVAYDISKPTLEKIIVEADGTKLTQN